MKLSFSSRCTMQCLSAALLVFSCCSSVLADKDVGLETSDGDAVPIAFPEHPLGNVPFRDTEYGDVPHYGKEDAPSRGYAHYDYPFERYGQWYRPRAFGLKQEERCLPRPFRPRGYGNLQKQPSTCYRMEYKPFELVDPSTKYGPSYFLRKPDSRCGGDELISIDNDVKWYRFNVFHQLHRVGSSIKSMLTF